MRTAAGGDEANAGADELRHFLRIAMFTTFIFGPFLGLIIWMHPVREDPSFSVRASDAHGTDPASSPVIHPSFNLTIRVDNDQDFATCREEVTVTVYYGTVVVGWADVPDFCVAKRSSAEMSVPLLHADVVLNNELRRHMAVELSSGDLELAVEMRMVFPRGILPWDCEECHWSKSRQSFQVCIVKPGHGYAPCQRFLLK